MAADDIYRATFHFESPTGSASVRLYLQETVARTGVGTDPQIAGESVQAAIVPLMLDCLSDDWELPSLTTEKVAEDPEAKWRADVAAPAGTRLGPSLPANNTLLFILQQGLFAARHNGKMFFPGVPEADTDTGTVLGAFLATQMTALSVGLSSEVVEVSAGAGRYVFGVVNNNVLDAVPPLKDWAGAFSQIIAVTGNTIISRQRRRQTRARGLAV